jgi:hypothetical protein
MAVTIELSSNGPSGGMAADVRHPARLPQRFQPESIPLGVVFNRERGETDEIRFRGGAQNYD